MLCGWIQSQKLQAVSVVCATEFFWLLGSTCWSHPCVFQCLGVLSLTVYHCHSVVPSSAVLRFYFSLYSILFFALYSGLILCQPSVSSVSGIVLVLLVVIADSCKSFDTYSVSGSLFTSFCYSFLSGIWPFVFLSLHFKSGLKVIAILLAHFRVSTFVHIQSLWFVKLSLESPPLKNNFRFDQFIISSCWKIAMRSGV